MTFTAAINANRLTIWKTLWNPITYQKWSSAFSPGSTIQSDWKEGSRVLFLDLNGDGIIYEIAEKKENELISFCHSGVLANGKEDQNSDKVKEWIGTYHNYYLDKNQDGSTQLTVELIYDEDYSTFYKKTWSRAIDHIKSLAETKEVDHLHWQAHAIL